MKNFIKLLVPVMVLVMVAAAMSVFASAAVTNEMVIYISSEGAGTKDGTSPENAMGNLEGYEETRQKEINKQTYEGDPARKRHALRNAVKAIVDNAEAQAGTIVVVGELNINCVDAYRTSPAEFQLSSSDKVITITSNYGGVDYTQKGAKIILDRTEIASINLYLDCPTIWKDLYFEYRTTDKVKVDANWDPEFMFEATGKSITMESGVVVTSVDYTDPANLKDSPRFPSILGGHRYSTKAASRDTSVTIKSGTWSTVYAAGHSMNASNHASVNNANILIEGGVVGKVLGAGSDIAARNLAVVNGNTSITVLGGEVGEIYGATSGGIVGTLTIKVTGAPKIGAIYATQENFAKTLPSAYTLDLSECTSDSAVLDTYYRANDNAIAGKTTLVMPTGYTGPAETTLPGDTTTPPATTEPIITTAPETTKGPEVSRKTSNKYGTDYTGLIVAIVIVVVLAAAAVVIVLLVKKNNKKKKAAKEEE